VTRELTDSQREGRTDASLVRAAATDSSAFGELYARHVETVYRWFRRRLDWAASDLTAETFARAWLVRGRFRDERGGSALPWLLGIAANVLADTVRRDRVETRALELRVLDELPYAQVAKRLAIRPAAARLRVSRALRRLALSVPKEDL
jgi:RNA polymerase sigma-70 factor (ECF subfamily)